MRKYTFICSALQHVHSLYSLVNFVVYKHDKLLLIRQNCQDNNYKRVIVESLQSEEVQKRGNKETHVEDDPP